MIFVFIFSISSSAGSAGHTLLSVLVKLSVTVLGLRENVGYYATLK